MNVCTRLHWQSIQKMSINFIQNRRCKSHPVAEGKIGTLAQKSHWDSSCGVHECHFSWKSIELGAAKFKSRPRYGSTDRYFHPYIHAANMAKN